MKFRIVNLSDYKKQLKELIREATNRILESKAFFKNGATFAVLNNLKLPKIEYIVKKEHL